MWQKPLTLLEKAFIILPMMTFKNLPLPAIFYGQIMDNFLRGGNHGKKNHGKARH
jgi:hypothetical protein